MMHFLWRCQKYFWVVWLKKGVLWGAFHGVFVDTLWLFIENVKKIAKNIENNLQNKKFGVPLHSQSKRL